MLFITAVIISREEAEKRAPPETSARSAFVSNVETHVTSQMDFHPNDMCAGSEKQRIR